MGMSIGMKTRAKAAVNKIMEWYRRYCFYEYGWIRAISKTKKQRKIMLLVFTPILFPLIGIHFLYEHTLGYIYTKLRLIIPSKKVFEDELSVVAIAKNEVLYIKEWLEYNKMIGVTRFYIYDNESTDNLYEYLESYIASGEVIYKYFPGRARQLEAYNDALKICRKKSKYVAFIDLDEFVVSVRDGKSVVESVEEILKEKKSAVGVAINWYTYGTSGHKEKPDGLVIENYLHHGNDDAVANRCIKTICNPRFLIGFVYDPHNPVCQCGAEIVTEKGDKLTKPWNPYPGNSYKILQINHYYCKSEAEARVKFERGRADFEEDIKYKWDQFYEFDRNEVYDPILLPYVEAIREKVK